MIQRPAFKEYDDLTRADFAMHPVWAWVHCTDYGKPWYDEAGDEAFRAWDGPFPVMASMGSFLVRAEFEFADGARSVGFITPQRKSKVLHIPTIHPTIFTSSDAKVPYWCGAKRPRREDLRRGYILIGRSPEELFPIRLTVDSALVTGVDAKPIRGFMWFDLADRKVRMLQ